MMSTSDTMTLSRQEIKALALTAPAAIGATAWLVPWIAYGAAFYLSIGRTPETTIFQITFVLMVLIGPISSGLGMIFTRTHRSMVRFSTTLYLLSGAWLIFSLAAIFMLITGQ